MFSSRKIILTIVLFVAMGITAYVLLVFIPRRMVEQTYEGARKIGRDIREAFQFSPEIKVDNVIVLQQQREILELATVAQQFQHRYTWTNTRLYSTKKIRISGTFEAKAGFDLNDTFTISINDGHAFVKFPEPKLLSLESLGDLEFHDENGIWNWIDQADRAQAINAFTNDARHYAAGADFVADASKTMDDKLIAILRQHVKAATITIGNTTHEWQDDSLPVE